MNMRIDIPQELLNAMENLANINTAGEKALKEAEPVVVEALKKGLEGHKDTGNMQNSIKATGPKEKAGGIFDYIRPTGKDEKGVRNMEKLAYLEYGTAKQAAKPVCAGIRSSVEKEVVRGIEKSLERSLKI